MTASTPNPSSGAGPNSAAGPNSSEGGGGAGRDRLPNGPGPGGANQAGLPGAAAQDADARDASPAAGLAADYAAKAGLHRTHDGRVDVLRSAGGVQGIAESILPGLLFLVTYTIARDLTVSLVAALAAAAVFTVVRLVQRRPLTQALAGVLGVGISAWVANTTGKAEDFYLPGFFTNAAYIVAMVISIAVKWPVAGLLFGFIRNEGLDWRKDPARVKAYRIGTWIIVAVLALRLVVQVPLYLLGPEGLAALATTRLIMSTPLYILGVWIAWLVTKPAPVDDEAADGAPTKG